ncbi:arylsulfatase [Comamonas badia]|uniref:arylsulfatase n=1 Tax=Comamonas badia TaxID=265291 RepID=UPI0003F81E4E|nr:arylsulfatase [Comamonas badia]
MSSLPLNDRILPLGTPPSASKAGESLRESTHTWRKPHRVISANAPNVLLILLDDAGFAQADTVGGPIHTPAFTRIAQTGIHYNAFHTTAICSATRASLLTGRNHHHVGNGVIAELASDWDGYTAEIPKACATIPEVLRHHGYRTAAFGKWHNTPVTQITSMGPFDRWPTGHGFDTFYGFLGGETSQYEPRLYRNTTPIEPPHTESYHLSEDLAQRAIDWLRERAVHAASDPFFLYWAPGAVHGPHHVRREWSDRYKGQFDDGWDVYRERAFERQKAIGFIPQDALLTPRPSTLPAWESLDPVEQRFQARLMEVFAGFLEHTDAQVGKLIDEIERQGLRENTLILYVFSDNGASAEGMTGSIAELNAQNGIPSTPAQHMALLEREGGLEALGSARFDSMYHAAWAWAGMAPLQGTKLLAGHFGGTRVPLAISWPARVQPDAVVRPQFHHVNDLAPTLYELIGIQAPEMVDGHAQEPLDGVSMSYTFHSATEPTRKAEQYFEVLGSRGIFHQGWMASAWGPRIPWVTGTPETYKNWDPHAERWELYRLDKDYSQACDLAGSHPAKLEELKQRFHEQALANHVYPLGAGLWPFLHPQDRVGPGLQANAYSADLERIPEFMAPNLRAANSVVTVDATVPANASGVVYALGGISGGVTLFFDAGHLHYEYNALMLKRTVLRSRVPVPAGRHRIELQTVVLSAKPGTPGRLVMRLDGEKVAEAVLFYTVPLAFTATETFEVGRDQGSPVSRQYFDRAPFPFEGVIHDVRVDYPGSQTSHPKHSGDHHVL